MVILSDWLTIIISTFFILKYYKRIVQSSRYLIYILFFVFYVFPLFLDCFFMPPVYSDWLGRGFKVAAEDTVTRTIYDIAIIYTQIVILFWDRSKDTRICVRDVIVSNKNEGTSGTYFFLWFGMIVPTVFAAFASSHKFILYTLQWREYYNAALVSRYTYCEKLSYIGVACSLTLLFYVKSKTVFRMIIQKILCIVFLYTSICIEGKRSIIFFSVLIILLIMIPGLRDKAMTLKERKRKIFRLIALASIALLAMVAFTLFVKIINRGYNPEDLNELYTAIRIDFLRDDRARLAIYSLIYPERIKMLEYMPQTFLSNGTAFFPIDYILYKNNISYPSYAQFLTSALLGYEHSAVMTPALYAEMISNFSIIGCIIMPFLCIWFSNIINRNDYPINVFILVCFVFLQMYDFTYIAYFIEFTFMLCLLKKIHLCRNILIIKVRK